MQSDVRGPGEFLTKAVVRWFPPVLLVVAAHRCFSCSSRPDLKSPKFFVAAAATAAAAAIGAIAAASNQYRMHVFVPF